MIRGKLGIEEQTATIFVFEELLAHLERSLPEKYAVRLGRWERALSYWVFDQRVCDYVHTLVSRYQVPVDILTWRPSPFAAVLHDRLWEMDVQVRETRSASYRAVSPWIATDPTVGVVYDADPNHRFGYGFKAREFLVAQI